MDTETMKLFFALLRSAIGGGDLTEEERALYAPERLAQMAQVAKQHDVLHLLAHGLKQSGLLDGGEIGQRLENEIFKAVYRCEQLRHELGRICEVLENVEIPFLPLKGSVLRDLYPEAWMRTSCDIDVLVHNDDLAKAVQCLLQGLQYVEKERATHDVSLFSPGGVHVEVHFDLVEEDCANNAIRILSGVWNRVSLCDGCRFRYEMSDELFYFYHIAHMAKHFENGGCGIRPLLDLWILDHMENANLSARNELLEEGHLLQFANAARNLSEVWFGGKAADAVAVKMQDFILHGGVYGSTDNRVAVAHGKKGGRRRYFLSRVFVPYARLKRYYPILEKHRWLTPLMQVRRWFMLLKPDVAHMAKRELAVNGNLEKTRSDEMNAFLGDIGLN